VISAAVRPPGSRPTQRMAHWTPRYVVNRTRQMLYERGHADDPWLTPAATRLLETLLRPEDRGVEFGSGRSTVWFAGRVAALTSVEHDEEWFTTVSSRLRERGLGNVNYILAPIDQPPERGDQSAYARNALAFPDESIDFALVDGHYRDFCAQFVLPKIRPGGMLIIDNVNWFLPSASRAPNSRSHTAGPNGPVWADVATQLGQWRKIWTGSGVWDTAMFIKP
jgi:predicted O-methyltransferase YrrM